MAYKGKYSGKELEEALDKASTAVQPSALDDWFLVVSAAIADFDERLTANNK